MRPLSELSPVESPGRPRPMELIGGFESTYQPAHDVDVAETTQHIARRHADLELVRLSGIRRVRYPVRWHRLERAPAVFDWAETDAVFELIAARDLEPIVDLVHHTSYPRWLRGGFADPSFASTYLRYVEAVFDRYPQIVEYTLFNEPFSTLFLCGHEGVWPPYGSSVADFVALLRNVLPALCEASRRCRAHRPSGTHMWCDTAERHSGADDSGREYAEYANDRRFFVLDAVLGSIASHPGPHQFVDDVVRHGGGELLDLEPADVDIVGLDYYAHCQWHFTAHGATAPTPYPAPLAELIDEYAARYRRPLWIGETNLRGYPSDRATWLKYVLEQCEIAVDKGVDLRALCWFPSIDSCDWDSLLSRSDGSVDPVGAFWLDEAFERRRSTMSDSFSLAANGTRSSELPAYAWRQPVASWLRGYEPQTAHWEFVAPPGEACREGVPGDPEFAPLTVRTAG